MKTICKYCGNEADAWQHPAGHIVNFCNCVGHLEATRMEKCSECGLYFNAHDPHPHHIFVPNKRLFMRWGYQAH